MIYKCYCFKIFIDLNISWSLLNSMRSIKIYEIYEFLFIKLFKKLNYIFNFLNIVMDHTVSEGNIFKYYI